MTKSFDEWFKNTMPNTHKGVGSEKIETFVYETAQDVWDHKQAEVDELQKRIDDALEAFDDGSFNYCRKILKGNTNEH